MPRTKRPMNNGFGNVFKKTRPYKSNPAQVRLAVNRAIMGQAEKKEIDTSTGGGAIVALQTSAPLIVLLNGVGEGSDYNTRIGRKINLKYVEGYISITASTVSGAVGVAWANQAAGNPNSDFGFWSLIYDRQANSAVPAFGDIYDTTYNVEPGQALRITSARQERFITLMREEWAAIGGQQVYHKHFYLDLGSKLKGKDNSVNYNGTGATVSAISSGALYLVVTNCTNNSATAAGQTDVGYTIKTRFTDM